MIRGVLFDFDGVLVSTVEMHRVAFRTALSQVGGRWLPEDGGKLDDHLNGLSTREKLSYLTQHLGLPEAMHDRIWNVKQSLTTQAIEQTIRPDAAKTGMLDSLKRLQLRLACVSNAIRPTTVLALQRADLMPMFEFVLTNEDVPRQKPHPAPYREAMRRLGLRPEECLAIEDAPHGVESARKSGAHVLAVETYREVTFNRVWQFIRGIDEA